MEPGLRFFVDSGKSWLTENWKLCKLLKDSNDVAQLKYWATDVYVALAMVNYPYEANFFAPLPANPIKVLIYYVLII